MTSKVAAGSTSSTPSEPPTELNDIQKANVDWKDAWFALFDWVEFNKDLEGFFVQFAKGGGGKYMYANEGSTKIKISALQDHAKTNEHRKLSWAKHGGQKSLQKAIAVANHSYNEALISLFRTTYFMKKESVPFHKFPSLYNLLVSCNAPMTSKLYHDEKACGEMVFGTSSVIQRKVLEKVRDSTFFGVMIDESIDISVQRHLVVFVTFLEASLSITYFLDLL